MKKHLFTIFMLILFIILSCSDDCEKEDPTLVLRNNGPGRADVQIKTSGGNTININNAEIGTSSEKHSFSPGDIEFTFSIQGVLNNIEFFLNIDYCTDYIVTIQQDTTIIATKDKRD